MKDAKKLVAVIGAVASATTAVPTQAIAEEVSNNTTDANQTQQNAEQQSATDLEQAQAALDNANAALDAANDALNAAEQNFENANAQVEANQNDIKSESQAQQDVSDAQTDVNSDLSDAQANAASDVDATSVNVDDARAAKSQAETNVRAAEQARDDAAGVANAAQADVDNAQQSLDAAANGNDVDVDRADNEAAAAGQALDTANTVAQNAADNQDAAKNAADMASTAQADAANAHDTASNAQRAAASDMDAKVAELEQAQANADAATAAAVGADDAADAANHTAQLLSEANAAKQQLDDANERLSTAQGALDIANQTLINAESTERAANADVVSAKAAYDAALANKARLEADGVNLAAIATAQQRVTNAEANLNAKTIAAQDAAAAYQKAQADVIDIQDLIARQTKTVEQARIDAENAAASVVDELTGIDWDKGSLGFFQWLLKTGRSTSDYTVGNLTGDKISVYSYSGSVSIEDADSKSIIKYTNLGADGDATSLENMREAISWMRVANQYREKYNQTYGLTEPGQTTTDTAGYTHTYLKPWLVSDTEMVAAQIAVNASANGKAAQRGELSHYESEIGSSGNLALGYENPFYGWYDQERANWLKLTNQDYDESLTTADNQTGHYAALLQEENDMMGFAVTNNSVFGGRPSTSLKFHDMTFGESSIKSRTLHATTWTVDEFDALFETYASLVDAKKNNTTPKSAEQVRLELEQARLAGYRDALVQAQTTLNAANIAQTEANTAKQDAIDALDAARAELEQTIDEHPVSGLDETEVNEAVQNTTDAYRSAIDAASAAKIAADAARNDVSVKSDNVASATATRDAAKKAADDANATLDAWRESVANIPGVEEAAILIAARTDANNALERAKAAHTTAKQTLNEADAALTAAKNALDVANSNLAAASDALNQANTDKAAADVAASDAKNAYDNAVAHANQVHANAQAVATERAALDAALTKKADADAAADAAQKAYENAVAADKSAADALSDAIAAHDAAVAKSDRMNALTATLVLSMDVDELPEELRDTRAAYDAACINLQNATTRANAARERGAADRDAVERAKAALDAAIRVYEEAEEKLAAATATYQMALADARANNPETPVDVVAEPVPNTITTPAPSVNDTEATQQANTVAHKTAKATGTTSDDIVEPTSENTETAHTGNVAVANYPRTSTGRTQHVVPNDTAKDDTDKTATTTKKTSAETKSTDDTKSTTNGSSVFEKTDDTKNNGVPTLTATPTDGTILGAIGAATAALFATAAGAGVYVLKRRHDL